MVHHLADIINNGQLYDEPQASASSSSSSSASKGGRGTDTTLGGGQGKRVPQKLALTATAALAAILDGDAGKSLVERIFSPAHRLCIYDFY
jgi:hypothetical protein